MTTIGELAGLTRPQLIDRVRELEAKLESQGADLEFALGMVEKAAREGVRAESRRACWALASFFGGWRWELRATRCTCGHVGYAHKADGRCMAGGSIVHGGHDCDCAAFVAREETSCGS